MKLKNLILGLAAVASVMGTANANAQIPFENGGNPGIVISGSTSYSRLPKKAQAFIKKHFKNTDTKSCEKYYAKGSFEVELANGIDLEFNSKGELTEIDAPDNTTLPADVVKDVMPHKAFSRLEKDGFSDMVESIEFSRGKIYEVDLSIPSPDTYVFDINGEFIAIEE